MIALPWLFLSFEVIDTYARRVFYAHDENR